MRLENEITQLEIPPDIFERMLTLVKANASVETCGILAGRGARVKKLYEMTNVENRSYHFMMEPKEQFAAVKDMRAAGLEILAIYHSHPGTPARPSAEDIRLALTPDVTHVIVSLQNPERLVVKGFAIDNGTVREVPIKNEV